MTEYLIDKSVNIFSRFSDGKKYIHGRAPN